MRRVEILCFDFPSEWEQLELFPLNDLHIGDPKTDEALFKRFVRYVQDAPNRFLVGIGDLMNNGIKNSVSNTYNETMSPRDQRKWLAHELQPIKDRILLFIDGNHEYRSKKEVDLSQTEELADSLGVRYLEDEAALKISVGHKRNQKPCAYTVYVTHGATGGKYPGAAVNNLQMLALTLENCDIVIVGHSHKKLGYRFRSRRFDPRNNRLEQVDKLCVVASAWQDFGGYAARKMYVPGAKGKTPIILNGREKYAYVVI
jgi:predicted phosphodiesterase